MKKKNLEKQYNSSARNYNQLHVGENKKSTEIFFKIIAEHIKKTKVRGRRNLLDLGCGDGTDFEHYSKQGFKCFGIDASSKMLSLAKKNFPNVWTEQASFAKPQTSFRVHPGINFNVIVSKWAIQTAKDIQSVYENVNHALAQKGYFIFLTVHPLRQFLEKKKLGKNYFKQEIVASEIFNKQITVYEPTHTLQEYLSPYFLKHFEVLEIKEDYEFPAAEQIGGDIYPTHLIVVARKK